MVAVLRRAARTDDNHAAIVQALRQLGCSVQSLAAVGKGCPDLLVGYSNRTILMEVKDGSKSPSRQKLRDSQADWASKWNGGPLALVTDVESALRAARMLEC